MADSTANQDTNVGPASETPGVGKTTSHVRTARPLKVAKALPAVATPTVPKSETAVPLASTLKSPLPVEGGFARPILLSEAKAKGLAKPIARAPAAAAEAVFAEALVRDHPASAETAAETEQEQDLGRWKWAASSWGISLIVHLVILLVLGLIVGSTVISRPEIQVSLSSTDLVEQQDLEEVQIESPLEQTQIQVEEAVPITDTLDVKSPIVDHLDPGAPSDTSNLVSVNDVASGAQLSPYGALTGVEGKIGRRGKGNGTGHATSGIGSHLGGRAERRAALAQGGPSLTDPVVDQGLNWLARHQLPDGGWAFNHTVGACRGQCPSPGDLLNARIAATGMALLPFLGAGHSHVDEKSPYWRTVAGGLRFLMAKQGPNGGLWEEGGQMYGHGIATLALCEAFGVANQQAVPPDGGAEPDYNGKQADGAELDPKEKAALEKAQDRQKKFDKAVRVNHRALGNAAKNAVKMTMASQHPEGGWRYHPGESGDMSVVGWQIMALASAQQAGFGFNRGTRDRAFNFMKICGGDMQGDQYYGAVPTRFSYLPLHRSEGKPNVTAATTAIGLLSMIYMGVHPHHPGMEVAVQRLRQQGPNVGDMYATYYQNQIMYQHGGQPWEEWKQRMEAALTGAQAKGGHVEGSWHLGGDHGSSKGGRVYCTVMALLCLEENYRHMRLFENAQANQVAKQVPPALAGGVQAGAGQEGGAAGAAGGAVGADGQPALNNPLPGEENNDAADGVLAPGAGVEAEPNGGDEQAAAQPNPHAKKKPSVPVGEDGFPLE